MFLLDDWAKEALIGLFFLSGGIYLIFLCFGIDLDEWLNKEEEKRTSWIDYL